MTSPVSPSASIASRRLAGVLGGMGPMATVDFLAKVIALTPASRDQDHIPLLAYQLPQIPDRSTAILRGTDEPFEPMLLGLRRLAQAGARFAVIPCNTAHHWYERLSGAQPMPILHIAEAVRQELERRTPRPVRPAILATRGTLLSGIYSGRLGAAEPVTLDEPAQQQVDLAIHSVKAGDHAAAAVAAREAGRRALLSGADVLILACTELPVALAGDPLLASCIDSTLALARLCILESANDPQIAGSPEPAWAEREAASGMAEPRRAVAEST